MTLAGSNGEVYSGGASLWQLTDEIDSTSANLLAPDQVWSRCVVPAVSGARGVCDTSTRFEYLPWSNRWSH